MEIYFNITQNGKKIKKFKLAEGEYVIIGRSEKSCQVYLNDNQLSSTHCKVSHRDSSIFIEDLDSKNGVYLNSVRILKQKMYLEDKVRFGSVHLSIDQSRVGEDNSSKIFAYNAESRGVGNLTLELDGYVTKLTNPHSKGFIRPEIKEARRVAYAKERIKKENKINTAKMKALKKLAIFVDIFLSILFFFLIIFIVKKTVPLALELEHYSNLFELALSPEMRYYSIISSLLTIIFLGVSRNIPSGSLGEKILRVN